MNPRPGYFATCDQVFLYQPLQSLLTQDEADRLCVALASTIGRHPMEIFLKSGPLDGNSMLVDETLRLRVSAPAEIYPLEVKRFLGPMSFPSQFSALAFLALHEAAHLCLSGTDVTIEQGCDGIALSAQLAHQLAPPKLSRPV